MAGVGGDKAAGGGGRAGEEVRPGRTAGDGSAATAGGSGSPAGETAAAAAASPWVDWEEVKACTEENGMRSGMFFADLGARWPCTTVTFFSFFFVIFGDFIYLCYSSNFGLG